MTAALAVKNNYTLFAYPTASELANAQRIATPRLKPCEQIHKVIFRGVRV